MGMRYSGQFSAVAVTALQDVFELVAPTDSVIVLHSVRLGQSSDAGDAQAEMLPVEIVVGRGTVTSGSGGTTPAKEALEGGFAASGATLEANNTTRMVVGSGTLHTIIREAFNVQVGWLYQPLPEERSVGSPGDRRTRALPRAPQTRGALEPAVVRDPQVRARSADPARAGPGRKW